MLLATLNQHIDVMTFLLRHGADITCKDGRGKTLLQLACESDRMDAIRCLVDEGAQMTEVELLHYVCAEGNASLVAHMLCHGYEIDATDESKATALHHAARNGRLEVIKLLIDQGADPLARTKCNETPLHWASNSRSHRAHLVIEYFVKNKLIDVDERDDNDRTPLHLACLNNFVHSALQLVANGADVRAKDKDLAEPIHLACLSGSSALLLSIMDCPGVEISPTDKDMRTPLHYASKSDHKGLVEELLNKGADINAMDNTNSTPLHDACYEGHEALSRFLANRGADTHVENEFGDTPMKIDYGRDERREEWIT